MANLDKIIDNYIQSEEPYALQIDGEWGVGKTYFVKHHVMNRLEEENNYPIYFSVYGYNNLNDLKRELLYQLISVLGSNKKIMVSVNRLNKKFKNFSDLLGDGKLKSFGLISDWVLEAYNKAQLNPSIITKQSIVIFIDDLERLSDNIAVKDLLGFILNELLEKIQCKVIILSNDSEIPDESDFKKIREKVISRTVKFKHDMSALEKLILKESRNIFIKEHSSWIKVILESQQNANGKKGQNIRTLFSIIDNFDFIESKLFMGIENLESDELKIKIRKSIFLNVFVITNEYKSGNVDEAHFELLRELTNTRYFSSFWDESTEKSIKEKIVDQYHRQSREFDEYIFYSSEINSYILFGYMDQINYVEAWKKTSYLFLRKLAIWNDLEIFVVSQMKS